MAKSLYSLILSDDVIARVDRAAAANGTNRSAMVNRILAEYCSVDTPEKRIENVFSTIERLISGDFLAVPASGQSTMMLKTSVAYRYRPAVKYDIRLYPEYSNGAVGEITVTIRTQAPGLLELTDTFFRLWAVTEGRNVPEAKRNKLSYVISPGRMTRPVIPDDSITDTEGLAEAISRYVRMFDRLFKAYIAGECTADGVENEYRKEEATI